MEFQNKMQCANCHCIEIINGSQFCSYECLMVKAKEESRLEPLDKKREKRRMNQIDGMIEHYKHELKRYKYEGNRDWCEMPKSVRQLPRSEQEEYFFLHKASFDKAYSFSDKQIEMCKLSIGVLTSIRDKRKIPKQKYLDFMDDFEDFIDEYDKYLKEKTAESIFEILDKYSFDKEEFYEYKEEMLPYLK